MGTKTIETMCPNCGQPALSHSTLSPDYRKVVCYNSIKKPSKKRGKFLEEKCGFSKFVKIGESNVVKKMG